VFAAGAIDNLIPPSIGFILYGIATETSIVKLFAAGAIPGLVLAAAFAAYIYRHAVVTGDQGGPPFRMREFVDATRDGFWPSPRRSRCSADGGTA
jgi:TRAP-type C4-dicarboxylate transport system permease large subunit